MEAPLREMEEAGAAPASVEHVRRTAVRGDRLQGYRHRLTGAIRFGRHVHYATNFKEAGGIVALSTRSVKPTLPRAKRTITEYLSARSPGRIRSCGGNHCSLERYVTFRVRVRWTA
jgi:hypothetical protein